MLELLGSFLTGLFSAVPQAVTSWVEGRNAVRIEHLRNQFDAEAQERSVRTARRMREIDLEFRQSESYPLGVPGKLGQLLSTSAVPILLVSPAPPRCPVDLDGVADRVVEILAGQSGFGGYATAPTGAFSRDGGTPRFIDGDVGARVVAEAEFADRGPAVIVYFVAGARTVTAHAYLSTVFGSVAGQDGIPYAIARYGRDGSGSTALRDAHLPSWHHIDLDQFPAAAPVDVVAATTAWFLLSVVDAYWQLTTGAVPGLLAAVAAAHTTAPADSPVAVAEREAARLSALGYDVTAELIDGGIGLFLTGKHEVAIVLGADYPAAPPLAIRVDGVDIGISPANWSPECTLADVVEALR
ncbi:hypothetical protein [Actinokineospora sp. NBRC 105648]|uniref:hypothetical protein n=1 Tax=Actinokineospora sp. NBRC 105648 TaxID=3032206 RepID=UPI0024A5AEAC|nr:hypothetical protein [Actinokineospora sp. NBRC 105648]GLZ40788.1 hypothetical protein Acsp05_44120 [Actinokineospora sp. NBRC 105648]